MKSKTFFLFPLLAAVVACSGQKDSDSGETAEDTGTEDTGTEDTGEVQEDVAISGEWEDNWGGSHSIENTSWTSGDSLYHISEYDNDAQFGIAHNDAGNPWNGNLWSRFDWTTDSAGATWFCHTAYDASGPQEALATPAADATDPPTSGCGGFSWTQLRTALDLSGSYTDNWGGTHVITAFSWTNDASLYKLSQHDNDTHVLVAQNDSANEWNADLWSRFDWTTDAEGGLWYCQTAYDAADEATALGTAAADATDPANSGCNGFSWTQLSE